MVPSAPFLGTADDTTGSMMASTTSALMSATLAALSPTYASFVVVSGRELDRNDLGLGNRNSVNASAILAMEQRHVIQVLATVTSTISIAAALCALYWFCIMRRNFRRDLVLLLIVGDLSKSFWFLLFSVVTFTKGPVKTGSTFCTSSGYLLQLSIDSCDIAIFLMSLHMILQIFPPTRSTFLGSDGLYRVRFAVLAAWIVIPHLMTSLAFVNPGPAFMTTGAWCTLPIRPIWYRLALSWIPRYLIWIFIMGVALRIYHHVGSEFKVFGQVQDESSGAKPSSNVSTGLSTTYTGPQSAVTTATEKESSRDDSPDDHHIEQAPNRKDSSDPSGPDNAFDKSTSSSRRGSHQVATGVFAEDFAPPAQYELTKHGGSIATTTSGKSYQPSADVSQPALPPIGEHKVVDYTPVRPRASATDPIQKRRRAMQRQLRLIFVYPVIYIMMWTIPFVVHCLNYSDYFAQHPIFPLNILGNMCQTLMGFTDVAVFCWREKPWKHIPGSDGTVLGSFCFWRFLWDRDNDNSKNNITDDNKGDVPESIAPPPPQDVDIEKTPSKSGLFSSSEKIVPTKTTPSKPSRPQLGGRQYSGGSDRRQLEHQRARERLAMEREAWEEKRKTIAATSSANLQESGMVGKKEWWDGLMDEDAEEHEQQTTEGASQGVA